ncbi:hypothetical protein AMECASPLE_019199, partial [Ameca splendens]
CSQLVIKESLKRTGVPEEDAREFSSQCVLHLLLKHVFLGSLMDDLPSSDSRRTYLWSPSEDPPHPSSLLHRDAPLRTLHTYSVACLSTLHCRPS